MPHKPLVWEEKTQKQEAWYVGGCISIEPAVWAGKPGYHVSWYKNRDPWGERWASTFSTEIGAKAFAQEMADEVCTQEFRKIKELKYRLDKQEELVNNWLIEDV